MSNEKSLGGVAVELVSPTMMKLHTMAFPSFSMNCYSACGPHFLWWAHVEFLLIMLPHLSLSVDLQHDYLYIGGRFLRPVTFLEFGCLDGLEAWDLGFQLGHSCSSGGHVPIESHVAHQEMMDPPVFFRL